MSYGKLWFPIGFWSPLVVISINRATNQSCDANAGWFNISRASRETCQETSEIYPFGSLFSDAIHLLNDFFTEPEYAPGVRPSKFLFGKVACFTS